MELTDGEKMVFACELSRSITIRNAQADKIDELGVGPATAVYSANPSGVGTDRDSWVSASAINDALNAVANLRSHATNYATESPGDADVIGSVFDIAP